MALVVKETTCQCRRCKRCRFNSWGRKIPWRRKWQPTRKTKTGLQKATLGSRCLGKYEAGEGGKRREQGAALGSNTEATVWLSFRPCPQPPPQPRPREVGGASLARRAGRECLEVSVLLSPARQALCPQHPREVPLGPLGADF